MTAAEEIVRTEFERSYKYSSLGDADGIWVGTDSEMVLRYLYI